MSLRVKVLGALGLLAVLASAEAGLVLLVQRDVRSANAAVERATEIRYLHRELAAALATMATAERGYRLSGVSSLARQYDEADAVCRARLDALAARISDPELQAHLRDIRVVVRDWQRTRPTDTPRRDDASAMARIVDDAQARYRPVEHELDAFLAREKDLLGRAQAGARRSIESATRLMIVIPLIGGVVIVVLMITADRRILRSLGALAAFAGHIRDGRYPPLAAPRRADEIGTLVGAFRDMVSAIREREAAAERALQRERDVSQRLAELTLEAEAAHAQLLQMLDTVPTGLILYDSTGAATMMNQAAKAMFGDVTNPDALAAPGAPVSLHDRGGRRLSPDEYASARALRGETVENTPLDVWLSDRRVLPTLISAAPVHDKSGAILGAVVNVQDITRLREVDQIKDEFVSIVSHELRTPLTSIRGSLQLVLDEPGAVPEADHQRLLHVALSNCERLIRIINDILDISKIEAGRIQLQLRSVAVEILVHLSVSNVEQIARALRIGITVTLPPDLPPVLADPDRFVQALVNLLSNAVKFAPADSTIEIDAAARGTFVAVSVRDHGPGIPAEHMDRLFEKFHQIDGSASRRAGGTGLGLAITKGIIEQHGGRITVQSQVGVGTSFTITVPIAPAQSGNRPPAPPATPPVRARPRVLVVDDDESLRAVVRKQLELAGYEVFEAADGQEAVALAHTHAPDVIVLDLMMPGHDGWTAIRELTGDPATAGIPIVVVSGIEGAGRSLAASLPLLRKPLDGDLLVREIRRVLGDREHAHVLVADDDDDLRDVLARRLRRRGYEVHTARDGREALALYEREPIDLIVLDLRMPGVDGFEVIRHLRHTTRGADVPIVVVSGSDAGDSQLRSLQLGANVYLTKPLNPSELLEEVGRLLRS